MLTCKYSLIIPVYQVEDYIVECLESIYCQIPEDVQVILVDDGSTDGSGAICDEYAARYAHTEVIHQKNQGVAAARNAGLDAAKGEYLLWVDPDDWVAENWFDQISKAISQCEPDVIVFDSLRVSQTRKMKEVYGREAGFVDKDVFCRDIARDIRMLSGMPNKVFKSSLFAGKRFDRTLTILEDYSLIFPVLQEAKKICYIPEILYFYRQHNNSLVHQYNADKSYLCVKLAERRRDEINACYQDAALVGVAIQAYLYCRGAAINMRAGHKAKEYKRCKQYIQENLKVLWIDGEIPLRWKCKFLLLAIGVLPWMLTLKLFATKS